MGRRTGLSVRNHFFFVLVVLVCVEAIDVVVNSTSDSPLGSGTLRQALALVGAITSSSNTIRFAASMGGQVIQVEDYLPVIACGSGCTLSIEATSKAPVAIDGQARFNLFVVDQATTLTCVERISP